MQWPCGWGKAEYGGTHLGGQGWSGGRQPHKGWLEPRRQSCSETQVGQDAVGTFGDSVPLIIAIFHTSWDVEEGTCENLD